MESRIRLKASWRLVGLAIFVVGLLGSQAQAGMITGIVSFGDSLCDVGNTYLAVGIPQSPPYDSGRYSNGPIWLEYLAGGLGVASPLPSLAGGLDNAWGGAQTGEGLSYMGTPNIGTQISAFLASNTLSGGELITIWGGANDFLNAGVTDPTAVVADLASEIRTLASAGGKVFMAPNLPLLGETPAVRALGPAAVAGMNALTSAFNVLLHDELDSLARELSVTIYQPDIGALFQNVLANPSAYGFTNVTDPLLFSGDPGQSGYLFWDTVHPTAQASRIIAQVAAASMVPEPSSMTLVLLATPLVLVWRRTRTSR